MPQPRFAEVEAVNARLRRIHRHIRRLEDALVEEPSGATLRRLDRAFKRRETIMRTWAEKVLPIVAGLGAREAGALLGIDIATSRLLAGTIQAITRDALADVAAQTPFLTNDARRLLRDIVRETSALHVRRGLSIPESKRIVRRRLERIGLRAFIDRSGRAWRPDTYAEMIMRTRTAIAYNAGTLAQGRTLGANRVEVFDGIGDAICADANGAIWTLEEAAANPVGHPNCVRSFAPFIAIEEAAA